MNDPEPESYEREFGPFFTAGVIALAYGLIRRRRLAVATGLGSIWIDQRTQLGRAVKRRIRSALEEKMKAHARDGEPETPSTAA
jgi:hypothetical protein